ncbi:MAG: hypothetical protein ABR509_03895 [Candidatus Limnocylindria bacterium]
MKLARSIAALWLGLALILAACNGGGGPTATNRATETVEATKALESTAPATVEETGAAETEPAEEFPSAQEEELLSHIPESLRADCSRSEFGAGVGIAAIGCGISAAGGDISVTYHLFDSPADMDEAYQSNLDFMGVERDAGSCEDATAWPGEGAYTIGNEDAGRVACVDFDIGYIISWTDDRLLIKGYAEGFDVGAQQFYEWWTTDSGPV